MICSRGSRSLFTSTLRQRRLQISIVRCIGLCLKEMWSSSSVLYLSICLPVLFISTIAKMGEKTTSFFVRGLVRRLCGLSFHDLSFTLWLPREHLLDCSQMLFFVESSHNFKLRHRSHRHHGVQRERKDQAVMIAVVVGLLLCRRVRSQSFFSRRIGCGGRRMQTARRVLEWWETVIDTSPRTVETCVETSFLPNNRSKTDDSKKWRSYFNNNQWRHLFIQH